MPFPEIDPIAFQIGPIAIRWYALAYLAGFVIGWRYAMRIAARDPDRRPTPADMDEFLTWGVLGVILGGRIGYVLFYNLTYFAANPLEIFALWSGGMSFHGGLVGVIVAMALFTRRRGVPLLAFADVVACVAPIGLFLGRIANFVNGELYGRVTDVAWGVVFPRGGAAPRHPSQLYEAFLEGAVLFVALGLLALRPQIRRSHGVLSGVFLAGYGASRIFVEFFREPDEQLGFLWGGATMGQLLSVPFVAIGLWLVARGVLRRDAPPEAGRPRSKP